MDTVNYSSCSTKEELFKEYERVIIESIITSFGLDTLFDFINKDKVGGDVDTIHNVRLIGKDEELTYKNIDNQKNYESLAKYDKNISRSYHRDSRYIAKNKVISKLKKAGNLVDAYAGKKFKRNERFDLDHVKSAKEIHMDPGRVLAGISGPELANADANLQPTNMHTNRSKKAKTMAEYLEKAGDEYTSEQKQNMMNKDKAARDEYESKIAYKYYTSKNFGKDLSKAAGMVGAKMGLRQAAGIVFAEIWFELENELNNPESSFNKSKGIKKRSKALILAVKKAKKNIKTKQVLLKLKDGFIAGVLASITTTLCNIFTKTARRFVKIMRESYVSFVQACKILFLNPEKLPLEDKLTAASKILSVGVSIAAGTLVAELISDSGIASIPEIGDIVATFCGSFVTGILSCTLLYFWDNTQIIHKLVSFWNNLKNKFNSAIADYYDEQEKLFEEFAAQLYKLDIEKFRKDIRTFKNAVKGIENIFDEKELNKFLKEIYSRLNIKYPWQGDFDSFMRNKSAVIHID